MWSEKGRSLFCLPERGTEGVGGFWSIDVCNQRGIYFGGIAKGTLHAFVLDFGQGAKNRL